MNITLTSTPIPDQEAAKLIGVAHITIRKAVKRGDLTRVPMAGRVQHVAKEQVELFRNRKIDRDVLNAEERVTWKAIETDILGKQQANDQASISTQITEDASKIITPSLLQKLANPDVQRGIEKVIDICAILGKPLTSTVAEQPMAQQKEEATPNFTMRQAQKILAGLTL